MHCGVNGLEAQTKDVDESILGEDDPPVKVSAGSVLCSVMNHCNGCSCLVACPAGFSGK